MTVYRITKTKPVKHPVKLLTHVQTVIEKPENRQASKTGFVKSVKRAPCRLEPIKQAVQLVTVSTSIRTNPVKHPVKRFRVVQRVKESMQPQHQMLTQSVWIVTASTPIRMSIVRQKDAKTPSHIVQPGIEFVPPTTTSKGACVHVGEGTFISASNHQQTSCTPHATCAEGRILRKHASSTRNRLCQACPAGSVSSGDNQASCTDCDGVNEYQDEPGQEFCEPVSSCPLGQGVTATSTPDADTVCEDCVFNVTFSVKIVR